MSLAQPSASPSHVAIRLVAALAAIIGWLPALPAGAQFLEPLDVIAQGVVELPAAPFAWRVREISYPRSDENPAPGFVAFRSGAGFVVRVGDGSAVAVERGEAAFVEPGPRRIAAMGGSDDGTLLEVTLVEQPQEGFDSAADTLSASFSFPEPNAHDLELMRGSIPAGETVPLPTGSGPLLVIAVRGAVTVEPQGAPFHRLNEGQFALVPPRGLLRVDTGKPHDRSEVLVILLSGLDAPPPAELASASVTGPRVDQAFPGIIEAHVRRCPLGTPDGGMRFACREDHGGVELWLDGENIELGVPRPIEPGIHRLGVGSSVDAFRMRAECRDQSGDLVSEIADTRTSDPRIMRISLRVEPGAQVSCAWYIMHEDLRGPVNGTASVAITFTRCPIGYRGADLATDCTDPVDGLFLSLDGPDAASGTTTDGEVGFTGLYGASLYELTAGIEDWGRAMLLDCRDASGAQVASPIDQHTSGIAVPAAGSVSCFAVAMDTELWWSLVEAPNATSP